MLKEMRMKILEQEYRFKKLKADRVEGLLILSDTCADEIANADITLEESMNHIMSKATQYDERKEEYIEMAKVRFQVWRTFLKRISKE